MVTETTALTRRRRTAVRVFAVLGLLTYSFMLVFVINDAAGRIGQSLELVPAGSDEARIGADHPGETIHIAGAAAALVLGATGLIGLIIRPQRAGSATHTTAASLAMLAAIVVVGDPDNYGGQGLPIDPAFLVLVAPPLAAALLAAPWRTWRAGGGQQSRLLTLALVALPGLWYALEQGLMQRNTWPPLADPHHQAHWYAMSLMAFATVFVIAGATLAGRGWRTAATTAGIAGAVVGSTSLLTPAAASALHPGWASAALVWGASVVYLTWKHKQPPAARSQEPTAESRL